MPPIVPLPMNHGATLGGHAVAAADKVLGLHAQQVTAGKAPLHRLGDDDDLKGAAVLFASAVHGG
jgi:hypothetical protein